MKQACSLYEAVFASSAKLNKDENNVSFTNLNFKLLQMKKTNFYKTELVVYISFIFLALTIQNSSSQTFCTETGTSRFAGTQDGYRYELWNQNAQGTACMTLGSGALFSGEWSGILNYLARRGLGYNQTQEHQEIGRFFSTFNCNYSPSSASGNSYLSIYGWTVDPLIEYYIIEDWRNWIPSMDGGATFKESFIINGSTYDIYENTRVNQPSIEGTATFQQYFSIRRDERNSGTIDISEHFDKWESLGMEMGKMYEVSFVVEGFQSNGSFEFTALDIYVENNSVSLTGKTEIPAFFSIFPNPAKDCITINIAEKAYLEIYNLYGQLLKQKELSVNENTIMVNGLTPGSYIVKIISGNRIFSDILIIE